MRGLLQAFSAMLLLVLFTGCFEVEQQLSIHPDGSVDHVLRIGQPTALAPATLSRENRWIDDVHAAVGDMAIATVDQDDRFTWYVLEAHLQSFDAYADYRDRVIAKATERKRAFGWAMPPAISKSSASISISLTDAGVSNDGAGEFTVNGDDPRYFTLRVSAPGRVLDHDADRTEANAVVWERPIGAVMQNGIAANATFSDIPGWALWAVLSLLALGLGVGGLMLWRGK